MIVVEVEPSGGYRVLDREREMVRLGRSALGHGELSEKAMRRGLLALHKMSTLARLKGAERVVVVATSAVREAANRDEFLARIRVKTGFEVRVLEGVEEARLLHRAVREAVDLGRGNSVILDVGGGSTEWIAARGGEARRLVSLPLGSLRLAGRLDGDPPSKAAIGRLRRRIRAAIRRLPAPARLDRLVATSGTAVCCADLTRFLAGEAWKDAGALREVRLRDLAKLVEHLRRLRRVQIASLPPVGEPRSESILAGAILLEELARHAGAKSLLVSDRALREGLVLEAMAQPDGGPTRPGEVRRRQVLQLARRGPALVVHADATARLATRLFDLTQSLHGFGATEREWLEYGALLHDLGTIVDYEKHHQHGYYLVASAPLDAFDRREIDVIAHLVRYHRAALPSRKHPTFRALKPWQQKTVENLTPVLRLAEALDRSHAQRVRDIFCSIRRRSLTFELVSPWDLTLEIDAASACSRAFERAYGRRLELVQGLEKVRAVKPVRRVRPARPAPRRDGKPRSTVAPAGPRRAARKRPLSAAAPGA
jgi:exopolyphosphatase/guanosine-5'-triphosphate,3'-diphosphate pyrophosphatase